ncbi:unnamed protein product, partial [Mycena citricolor]
CGSSYSMSVLLVRHFIHGRVRVAAGPGGMSRIGWVFRSCSAARLDNTLECLALWACILERKCGAVSCVASVTFSSRVCSDAKSTSLSFDEISFDERRLRSGAP